VVGEEIDTGVSGRILARGRVVERSSRDGASEGGAGTVSVNEGGAEIRWIGGGPFGCRPAVIRSGDTVIDLLPGNFTDVIDEHSTRTGLDPERERMRQPSHRDDLM